MSAESDPTDGSPTDSEPSGGTGRPKKKAMNPLIFVLQLVYLLALGGLFASYAISYSFRHALPANLGPLPLGVIWFGAAGAVISAFRGIFYFNQNWDSSFNYWYYSRPFFGAVTGTAGTLMYWVTLRLGDTTPVIVDRATFYAASFVLGFADEAFFQLLQSMTQIIIKPGKK